MNIFVLLFVVIPGFSTLLSITLAAMWSKYENRNIVLDDYNKFYCNFE